MLEDNFILAFLVCRTKYSRGIEMGFYSVADIDRRRSSSLRISPARTVTQIQANAIGR